MTPVLYTIGHSVHSLDRFVELLRVHGVSAILDAARDSSNRRKMKFLMRSAAVSGAPRVQRFEYLLVFSSAARSMT